MKNSRKEKLNVLVSAHRFTNRENLGDVLSGKAIIKIFGSSQSELFFLPDDIGKTRNLSAIYGGGGMIRPNFVNREVYKDLKMRRGLPYWIYGVGQNVNPGDLPYSKEDKIALAKWLAGAEHVSVRDLETQKFVRKELNVSCSLAPCPTYTVLNNIKLKESKIYKVGIVISLGHTKSYKKYKKDIVKFVYDVSLLVGRDGLVIICHDQNDYLQSKKIFKNIKIFNPETFTSVKRIYGRCRGVISLRGHGIIFSAASQVPCSPIAICDKLKSLYYYHYKKKPMALNFNAKKHLNYLKRKIMPVKIKAGIL